jgi:hypothetical protein
MDAIVHNPPETAYFEPVWADIEPDLSTEPDIPPFNDDEIPETIEADVPDFIDNVIELPKGDDFKHVKENLPLSQVIRNLTGESVKPGSKKNICCPFPDHDDKNPSFSINESDDLFNCFGCNRKGSSIDFIMEYKGVSKAEACNIGMGILGSQRKVKPKPKREVRPSYKDIKTVTPNTSEFERDSTSATDCYDYNTPDGQPHIKIFRKVTNGKKHFVPYTWNGENWIKGCPEDTPRYLYRIEKITDSDDVIFLVEGEKDVHTLEKLGLAATTWAGGTNSIKGQCERWNILSPLQGKDVYFIPDNDEPGERAFNDAIPFLFSRVDELHKVTLPDLPEKGDVTDFVEMHQGEDVKELLLKHSLCSPLYVPDAEIPNVLYSASTLKKIDRPVPEFIVDSIIPVGLTLLGGKKKARKSVFCHQVALAVSLGIPALGQFQTKKGTAIHCALEEDDYWWNKRMSMMLSAENGCDPTPTGLFVAFFVDPLPKLLSTIENWKRDSPDLKIIFLDVMRLIVGQENDDKLKKGQPDGGYSSWYSILMPLKRLAKKLEIAIVIVHHMKKGTKSDGGDDIFDGFVGSTALTAVTDSNIALTKICKSKYQGTLEYEGRMTRDVPPIALAFDGPRMTYTAIGPVDDLEQDTTKGRILQLLREEKRPMGASELHRQIGSTVTPEAVRKMLSRMHKDGELFNDNGKYSLGINR